MARHVVKHVVAPQPDIPASAGARLPRPFPGNECGTLPAVLCVVALLWFTQGRETGQIPQVALLGTVAAAIDVLLLLLSAAVFQQYVSFRTSVGSWRAQSVVGSRRGLDKVRPADSLPRAAANSRDVCMRSRCSGYSPDVGRTFQTPASWPKSCAS